MVNDSETENIGECGWIVFGISLYHFRQVSLVLVLSLLVSSLFGQDKPFTSHPELHRAALAGFTYSGTSEAVAAKTDEDPSQDDPNIVRLRKMEITASKVDATLDMAIKKYAGSKPESQRALGTGVIERDFGKVRMDTITVLYIPLQIGFSW